MNTHRLLNWYERVAPWIPYNEGFQTRSTDVSDLLPKYQHDFAQSHGKSELILSRDQAERLVNAIMTMPKAKLADDRAKAAYSAAVEDPLTEFTPEGRPIGTRSRSNIRIKPEPIKTRYGDNWQITWPLHDLYIEPGFHFEGRSFHEDEDPEVPPIWEMPELVDLEGNDLSDEDDNFYEMTWDQALMFPMMEMARERVRFVSDILYIYNDDNPINDHKVDRQKQIDTGERIRSRHAKKERLE